MKTFHNINKYALISTFCLYFTVYLAVLGQVLLGIIQIIIAALITFKYYGTLPQNLRLQLVIYWASTLIAVGLIALVKQYDPHFSNDFFAMGAIYVIPMGIACYFLNLTHNIKKHLNP